MSDLISRQAAIDAICRDGVRLERGGALMITISTAKQWVVDLLDKLPSAQPETHDKRTETHACDLISRAEAIDALGERPMVWAGSDYELGARNQYDADVLALETVPSAQPSSSCGHEKDAQPKRMPGKWIAVTEDGDVYKRICSCCGREAFFQDDDPDELYDGGRYELSDFCPHCGADMRGETE